MDFTAQLVRFNRSVALERVGGDEELFREIAELFLEESPALVAEIEVAIAAGDAERIHRAAHTLKGSLAALGAEIAARSALELEGLGRSGDVAAARTVLDKVRREMDELHPELVAIASGISGREIREG